ncbi:MAG: NTP transferase domain-containing protein, partial [Anaerolineaceae bacterium]|nr:NTP transferase domain-containing protein [Anaerolineaceae bacterium]
MGMNTGKKIIAIVQGRMGSNRLPGKILLDIGGQPMLALVVNRTRRARFIEQVVVATTLDPSDDPVAEFCRQQGYPYYRGDIFDVLDRYYQAALIYQADVVVRITADCPVIDPAEIDRIVEAFL